MWTCLGAIIQLTTVGQTVLQTYSVSGAGGTEKTNVLLWGPTPGWVAGSPEAEAGNCPQAGAGGVRGGCSRRGHGHSRQKKPCRQRYRERSGLWEKQEDLLVQLVHSRKDRSEGAQSTQQGFFLRAKRSLGRGRTWRDKALRTAGHKWDWRSRRQETVALVPDRKVFAKTSTKGKVKMRKTLEGRDCQRREAPEGPGEEPI